MHIFFKLPRPVDRPIESQFPVLPILYARLPFSFLLLLLLPYTLCFTQIQTTRRSTTRRDVELKSPERFVHHILLSHSSTYPFSLIIILLIAYLSSLHHTAALCDHCMDRISGEWFRCVYCPKDLCDVCENLNAHNPTHFFYVFKAPVSITFF